MDFAIRLISPSFDSQLTSDLFELNHLKKLELQGTTSPHIFFQLKHIFHMLESVGSARIEGNRTTVAEYIDSKMDNKERSNDRLSEIANVESAMAFIEANIREGTPFTHQFIRQLHTLVVEGLKEEGDKTPGAYRTWNVKISNSHHSPPNPIEVHAGMDRLIEFINEAGDDKYDLLKTAIAHHKFTWIHPFGNGNGRVVRLLTYALMIKYGFHVQEGRIINPTAVFCNNRNEYYDRLSEADSGTNDSLLSWCEYVASGLLKELTKVNKLLDFPFLHKNVLVPTIQRSRERGYINDEVYAVLKVGVQQQVFKSSDLSGLFLPRKRILMIANMKAGGLIKPTRNNGREYVINFMHNALGRSLIHVLETEGFIPKME